MTTKKTNPRGTAVATQSQIVKVWEDLNTGAARVETLHKAWLKTITAHGDANIAVALANSALTEAQNVFSITRNNTDAAYLVWKDAAIALAKDREGFIQKVRDAT